MIRDGVREKEKYTTMLGIMSYIVHV